ncbi:MAG: biopolymer transporter ExbD [SAR324 cluster bacterium]|nr:biopolymer transporter ExbD [SAR324 cluster bacterium]MCZ6532237.1 biopolymer transporter ExbD [SAR324 cluster bacterium]MCZ6558608.1 biopolymer transporter ExbD [SAR324 cluster bacterium]MCZ6628977.1 biopolymer transporter ExbD [SAR324 cluster bacterium]MCZ6644789.1 biopolymer transporter ExbD [SAR324 cluster bacterium]
MHGRVGTEWTSSEPMSEINVVPLVDVLLVLLVIFMITAPIISHTLDVQLPRASLAPGTRADQTLIITIDRKGTLAVNDRVMGPIRSREAGRRFNQEINRWKAKYPGNAAYLRADRRIRYGTVIQVMARLRRLGVVDVGLMIEREGS